MSERTGLERIKHGLYWRYKHAQALCRSYLALYLTKLRWLRKPSQTAHTLPAQLIVSLTSYRPRFATLLPTLQCLLTQTVKPDKVILWVDDKDMQFIPAEIKALESLGLSILSTETDIGPYKKIIPALKQFPDAFIATADDDVYYRPTWLEVLLTNWNGNTNQIVCHRAHAIVMDTANQPIPYHQWKFEVAGPLDSTAIFPTGVGGVLYPPHCMDAQVTDEATFVRVCPKADDIWLFWMARRAGTHYKKTEFNGELALWPGSQKIALMAENLYDGGNDKKISSMIDVFGWPTINPVKGKVNS